MGSTSRDRGDWGAVSLVAVAAIFLSNVPEGLASAAGMKKAGRSAAYVFGVWAGIALISAVASFLGFAVFAGFSPRGDRRNRGRCRGRHHGHDRGYDDPRSLEQAHDYAGLITVAGFLAAFSLSKLSG